jgi:uncharacterized protein YjdB
MLTGRKLPLTLAFAVLVVLAFGAGCKGFFVKPTLTSIAVGPATPTLQFGSTTNNTQQFTAFGTFDDGSHGNPPVSWNSDTTAVATISNSGLATAVSLGTAKVTATSTQNPTIAGSTTLTVTVPCLTSIAVTPLNPTVGHGGTQQFTAMATTCNGVIDITKVATWSSSQPTVATIDNTGLATAIAIGTTNITATSVGVTSTPVAVLTVN